MLESELRKEIIAKAFGKDIRFYRFLDLIDVAMKYELINTQEDAKIKEWVNIRNRLVHTKTEINNNEAENILNGIIDILKNTKERVK